MTDEPFDFKAYADKLAQSYDPRRSLTLVNRREAAVLFDFFGMVEGRDFDVYLDYDEEWKP